jgi:hypothetical protein
VLWRLVGEAFPPHVAIVTQSNVREDRVAPDRVDRCFVGRTPRARCNAEESCLWIDRAQSAVFTWAEPRDVVADRLDRPARDGRLEHREVRLPARRREGGRDVEHSATRIGDLEDEHVLGEPALVPSDNGCDAQRERLLREQGVSTVCGSERPDLARLWKVGDVLRVVTRPRHIRFVVTERRADAVNCGHPLRVVADKSQRLGSHPRHQAHADHDVWRVGDLHAKLRQRRAERSHRERDDVHRATAHASREELAQRFAHLLRVAPVVGRAGVVWVDRANEGAVLNPRDIGRVAPSEETVRAVLRIEPDERALIDEEMGEPVALGCTAVAPHDLVWPRELCDLFDPRDDSVVCFVGNGGED